MHVLAVEQPCTTCDMKQGAAGKAGDGALGEPGMHMRLRVSSPQSTCQPVDCPDRRTVGQPAVGQERFRLGEGLRLPVHGVGGHAHQRALGQQVALQDQLPAALRRL